MDRRGFLNQVWKNSIRPILIITIVVCIAAIVLNDDASKLPNFTNTPGEGINWTAIGQLLISIITNNWQIILLAFSPFLLFWFLRKIIPSRHHPLLKKINTLVLYVLYAGFLAWFGYKCYQNKQYEKIILVAVILVVSIVRSYLREKTKHPLQKSLR